MKRMRTLFALLFVLMALCCTGVTAFAQSNGEAIVPPTVYSEPAEAQNSEAPALTPLPEPAVSELPEESPAPQLEAASEQPSQGNNLPYYVGAGIAVLVFIGVAIFCKVKGRN